MISLDAPMHGVTISQLRQNHPAWVWEPVRRFGRCDYVGRCGGVRADVYAVSRLCGPGDDDCVTEWRFQIVGDIVGAEVYGPWVFDRRASVVQGLAT